MVKPDTDIKLERTGSTSDKSGNVFFHVINSEGIKAISKGWAEIV